MKMKSVLIIGLFISQAASASVETATVRLSTAMPNKILAPLGQLVDLATGEELYVTKIISVLAPRELETDCHTRSASSEISRSPIRLSF